MQASTEKQKKYDENVWKDIAESVQEMYDKQQISAEQYINRINSLLPEAYEKGYNSADKYAKAVNKVEKEQTNNKIEDELEQKEEIRVEENNITNIEKLPFLGDNTINEDNKIINYIFNFIKFNWLQYL